MQQHLLPTKLLKLVGIHGQLVLPGPHWPYQGSAASLIFLIRSAVTTETDDIALLSLSCRPHLDGVYGPTIARYTH